MSGASAVVAVLLKVWFLFLVYLYVFIVEIIVEVVPVHNKGTLINHSLPLPNAVVLVRVRVMVIVRC